MERTYAAPAQRVFDAFTSEEVMRRWWHAGPDWETPEATVDLRVGGALRVVMRNPHEDVRYGGGGEYTEIDPPARLAFTWTWDDDPRDQVRQLIEIDFEETDGATRSASPTAACGTRRRWPPTRTAGAGRSRTWRVRWKPEARLGDESRPGGGSLLRTGQREKPCPSNTCLP